MGSACCSSGHRHATSQTVDTVVSGMVIAGGTKGVHDFLSLIQNANSPKTGSQAG